MLNKKYRLSYLPLFYEDLDESLCIIVCHEHFAFTNLAVKYGVVFYNKVGYNKINRKANESCKQGAETYAEYQTYI